MQTLDATLQEENTMLSIDKSLNKVNRKNSKMRSRILDQIQRSREDFIATQAPLNQLMNVTVSSDVWPTTKFDTL